MTERQSIEMVQVRWDGVLVYKHFTGAKGQSRKTMERISRKAYSGQVCEAARKRMLSAIDLMIQLSRVKIKVRPNGKALPHRLGFLTLTVPGVIRTPQVVHLEFKKFLDWLRYRNCLYVWKAEYQKRGQVHYHLIINQYIPWVDIRDGWNKILKKKGFLNGFAKRHGHFCPNSVDIRSVKSKKALSKYLSKYLLKDDGKRVNRPLKKWWSASSTLLGKRFTTEMWSGDWEKVMSCKNRVEDVEGRWMIAKGGLNQVLSGYSKSQYLQWRLVRRSSGWKPPAKVKSKVTSPAAPKEKVRQLRLPIRGVKVNINDAERR